VGLVSRLNRSWPRFCPWQLVSAFEVFLHHAAWSIGSQVFLDGGLSWILFELAMP
jgi:hypothetical protein